MSGRVIHIRELGVLPTTAVLRVFVVLFLPYDTFAYILDRGCCCFV